MAESIHESRFNDCRTRIQKVLATTIGWLYLPEQSYPHWFVAETSKEYLKNLSNVAIGGNPDHKKNQLIQRLVTIKDCIQGTANPQPTWDIRGVQWKKSKDVDNAAKLNLAYAHSKYNGANGDKIRIQQKAWTLPNYVLEGVMVHEVTHFAFGTIDDSDMATGGYYVFSKNQRNYSESQKWNNADNWRLFYQAMRAKLIADI